MERLVLIIRHRAGARETDTFLTSQVGMGSFLGGMVGIVGMVFGGVPWRQRMTSSIVAGRKVDKDASKELGCSSRIHVDGRPLRMVEILDRKKLEKASAQSEGLWKLGSSVLRCTPKRDMRGARRNVPIKALVVEIAFRTLDSSGDDVSLGDKSLAVMRRSSLAPTCLKLTPLTLLKSNLTTILRRRKTFF